MIETVELTVDSFVKAFGRAPSEKEIGMMMNIKATQQEKQINTGRDGNTMQRSKISQMNTMGRGGRKRSKKVKVSAKAFTINKMLTKYSLLPEDIAAILGDDLTTVNNCIARFRLPREECIVG